MYSISFLCLCFTALGSFGALFAIENVVYEYTGWLTILSVSDQRSVSPKDVFLAVCDRNLNFTLYPNGPKD